MNTTSTSTLPAYRPPPARPPVLQVVTNHYTNLAKIKAAGIPISDQRRILQCELCGQAINEARRQGATLEEIVSAVAAAR